MTDTQKAEEWEGPPLDQEEEETPGSPHPESTSPTEEGDSANPANNSNPQDDETTPKASDPEENKENVERSTQQSGEKESSKTTKAQSESGPVPRGRSRSRPTRGLSTKSPKMSNGQRDDGNASTTAVSSPEKEQPLPDIYEDKNSANKGQLVKRNRRRNRKSGYESSATEEMPLRERQYPPQQQMQMQQQPAQGKKSDPIKLRLDLNLEVEVELKARIHGDLTLSLLS